MKLDDFSKIYNGGKSIVKVHGGELAGLGSRFITIDSQRIDKITASTTYAGTSANMLFDGIIGNDTNRWVSTENDTQPKLTITLDELYAISQIIIHNGLANSYYIQEVEVIVDGINQGTFIGNKTPISIGLVNVPMGKVIELKFPAGHNRIYEIEIYGKERSNLIWPKEPDVYLAQDSDFVKVSGYWVYRGAELEVEIPTHINGELVTSTARMFNGGTILYARYDATPVTKVVLRHANVTDMSYMFGVSSAPTLDLSHFDTSNVTSMEWMFNGSKATTLDLSSFNTTKVTSMHSMFKGSNATTLDLSSFDTSNVALMNGMFQSCKATTVYARTQADANKFNASSNKPAGLNFVVKP